MMKAVPAEHFARPPYRAECFSSVTGWSGVMNRNGINCLTWIAEDGKPSGGVVTDLATAQRLAEAWNGEKAA